MGGVGGVGVVEKTGHSDLFCHPESCRFDIYYQRAVVDPAVETGTQHTSVGGGGR